jgi:hypothetical protein
VFPYETVDGKISIARLYTQEECQDLDDGSFTEIDSDHFSMDVLPSWSSGQEPVSKVILSYNKHPVDDKYFEQLEINFKRTQSYYQDFGQTVDLECPSLYLRNSQLTRLTPLDPQLPAEIAVFLNPLWGRHTSHPAPVITATCPYSDMIVNIGDIVKVTHPGIVNLRTSGLGFSGEYFQVMGTRPSQDKQSIEENEVQVLRWYQ